MIEKKNRSRVFCDTSWTRSENMMIDDI